jgi:hypothetical protein
MGDGREDQRHEAHAGGKLDQQGRSPKPVLEKDLKPDVRRKAGQRKPNRVYAAAEVIPELPLARIIEKVAKENSYAESRDDENLGKTAMPPDRLEHNRAVTAEGLGAWGKDRRLGNPRRTRARAMCIAHWQGTRDNLNIAGAVPRVGISDPLTHGRRACDGHRSFRAAFGGDPFLTRRATPGLTSR